jgi:glycosyltransferase involved in cell wall biosynthesis
VLLPNYNHSRYLRQCLAGLLNQTYEDIEIVLTDDGSTDGSQDIIREYAAADPRLKVNMFPSNLGIKRAFEDICERGAGKYIFATACDDFVVNKDFFGSAIRALEEDPRPAGFYGITGIYLAEKEKLVNACGTAEVEGYNTPLQCCQGFLKCRSVVTSPSCIWRRDLFNRHGAANMGELITHLGPQMDFYLNHALAFTHGMHYQKTAFACQRIYEAKTNYSANLNLWDMARRFAELERRLRACAVTYPEIEADWLRWRAYWMMDTIRKSGIPI